MVVGVTECASGENIKCNAFKCSVSYSLSKIIAGSVCTELLFGLLGTLLVWLYVDGNKKFSSRLDVVENYNFLTVNSFLQVLAFNTKKRLWKEEQ